MSDAPQLTVLLSTLGNYEVLERVLDGYDRQDAPPESFELVVVVDKADPHPERVDAAIGERPYPVRRLTGHMPGLSANRNTGWRAARAPIVLTTDNDTIPVKRLVSEHLAWHRRHPDENVAVVGHVRWAQELELTPFMRWLDRGVQFDFIHMNGIEASWAQLYGANSSMKRSFIERVGDWDEVRLPYLYDDLDWSYRASKHGLRVLYNKRAVVDHLRHDANLEWWKQKMDRSAKAERQFTAIHPELEPWFYRMFTGALMAPPHRGRGARLARFVPRWVPWLGPYVWRHAETYWKQQLAPHFLEAWERYEPQPSGSSPAGP